MPLLPMRAVWVCTEEKEGGILNDEAFLWQRCQIELRIDEAIGSHPVGSLGV